VDQGWCFAASNQYQQEWQRKKQISGDLGKAPHGWTVCSFFLIYG
jgi:hypothetical protein